MPRTPSTDPATPPVDEQPKPKKSTRLHVAYLPADGGGFKEVVVFGAELPALKHASTNTTPDAVWRTIDLAKGQPLTDAVAALG